MLVMALGSTQPLTEMSTRCISSRLRLTLPPPCAVVMKSGNLNFLEPSGPLQACNETAFIGYSSSAFTSRVFLYFDSAETVNLFIIWAGSVDVKWPFAHRGRADNNTQRLRHNMPLAGFEPVTTLLKWSKTTRPHWSAFLQRLR